MTPEVRYDWSPNHRTSNQWYFGCLGCVTNRDSIQDLKNLKSVNWLVVSTHLKNKLVKLDHFTNFWDENKKYVKPKPPSIPMPC